MAAAVKPETDARFPVFVCQPVGNNGMISTCWGLRRGRPCEGQSGDQKGGMISLLMEFPFAGVASLMLSRPHVTLQIPDDTIRA